MGEENPQPPSQDCPDCDGVGWVNTTSGKVGACHCNPDHLD